MSTKLTVLCVALALAVSIEGTKVSMDPDTFGHNEAADEDLQQSTKGVCDSKDELKSLFAQQAKALKALEDINENIKEALSCVPCGSNGGSQSGGGALPTNANDCTKANGLYMKGSKCTNLDEKAWGSRTAGRWKVVAPNLGTKTVGACSPAAGINGEVWVAGGKRGGRTTNKISVRKVGEVKWTTFKTKMKTKRFDAACFFHGNTFYSVGGEAERSFYPLKTAESMTAGGKAKLIGRMKTGRKQFCAVSINGHGYVFGGVTSGRKVLKSAEKLNFGTGKWSSAPDMPTRRYAHGCVVNDNLVYIAGGSTRSSSDAVNFGVTGRGSDTLMSFNPTTGKYRDLKSMKMPRSSFGFVALGDMLYAIGGWGYEYNRNQQKKRHWFGRASTERYNLVTRKWESVKPMKFRRTEFTATAVAQDVYVMGGQIWGENGAMGQGQNDQVHKGRDKSVESFKP